MLLQNQGHQQKISTQEYFYHHLLHYFLLLVLPILWWILQISVLNIKKEYHPQNFSFLPLQYHPPMSRKTAPLPLISKETLGSKSVQQQQSWLIKENGIKIWSTCPEHCWEWWQTSTWPCYSLCFCFCMRKNLLMQLLHKA